MNAVRLVGSMLTVAAVMLSQSAVAEKAALIHGKYSGWDERSYKAEFDDAFKALGITCEKDDKYLSMNFAALTAKLEDYDLVVIGFGVKGKDLVFSEEDTDKWRFWLEGGGVLFVPGVLYQSQVKPWTEGLGEEFYLRPAELCTAYKVSTIANQRMEIDRDALLEFPRALGKAVYNRGKHWVHFLDAAPGWKVPIRCVDGAGLFAYREVGAGLVMFTQIWDLRKYGSEVTIPVFANALAYTRLRKAGFRPKVADGARLALANEKEKTRQLTIRTTTNEESPTVKMVALKPGQAVELFPDAKRKAFGTVRRHLTITEGGKTVLDWGWAEEIDPPIAADLHRTDVFAGQSLKARFTFNPTEGKTDKFAGFEWRVDGGKWTLQKNGADLAVPVDSLKEGVHELSYRLRLKGDLSSQYVGKSSFKVHQKVAHCQVRSDGVMLLDGKPFFPFGFYDVILWNNAEPVRSELIANMGKWGYNMAQMAVKMDEVKAESDVYAKFLDFCQEKDIKLLVSYVPDYFETNLITRATGRFGNHPSIIGWSLFDEPFAHNIPPSVMRSACELIHANSPDRLTYSCLCLNSGAFRYSPYVDILATDPYPGKSHLTVVWRSVTSVHEGIAYGGASQWACLQLHGGQGHSDVPEVTPRMFRSETYLAAIAGARGIIYYAFRDHKFILTKASAELQEAVAKFPSEFNRYTPYFLDGKRTVLEQNEHGVFSATWEKDGKTLYVALNANRKESATTTIPFTDGKVECQDETVKLDASGKLELGPFDRIVILK